MQRIGAADLVAVHEIDVGRHLRPEHRQLRRVVLRVAVGVEDQLLGRRPEAGLQRGAVVAVLRMVHGPDLRIGAGELVGDLRRAVGAAVVDDDDLEIRGQLRRGLDGADHHAGDGAAVVVGREEDTQARWFASGRSWHGMSLHDNTKLTGRYLVWRRATRRHGVQTDSRMTLRDSFDSP